MWSYYSEESSVQCMNVGVAVHLYGHWACDLTETLHWPPSSWWDTFRNTHHTKIKLWGRSYSIYKDRNCTSQNLPIHPSIHDHLQLNGQSDNTYQQHPACRHHLLFFSSCPSFSSFCTMWKSQVIYISGNSCDINFYSKAIYINLEQYNRYIFMNATQKESLTSYRLTLLAPVW